MDKINNIKKIPHFTFTIGMLPTSFQESLTYQEQLLWIWNYLTKTIEPSLNNTINSFNTLLDEFNTLDTNVNETLETALTNLNNDLEEGLTNIQNYFSEEVVTITTNYINEHINNGDIYLSLGMDYNSTTEEMTLKIESTLSEELIERLATLATPQEEV